MIGEEKCEVAAFSVCFDAMEININNYVEDQKHETGTDEEVGCACMTKCTVAAGTSTPWASAGGERFPSSASSATSATTT